MSFLNFFSKILIKLKVKQIFEQFKKTGLIGLLKKIIKVSILTLWPWIPVIEGKGKNPLFYKIPWTQECWMQFYLMENQETIVEANLKVSNTSSKIIGQYIVEGWRIEDFYDVESNITMKRVIVSLIRSQSVTIFVTHLLTYLLF